MKAVQFIVTLIVLLVTAGSASAEVVLTTAYGTNPGRMQVDVIYNIQNSTITFLDQSTGVNSPGILGVAYNLNTEAQQITGYELNSDTEHILYGANSQGQNEWVKKTNTNSAGDVGNLLSFYSANTDTVSRFHKIVVKLPNFTDLIPPDVKNNQVGVQFVCDQFTAFVAGPGNSGTTNYNSALLLETTASSQTYDSVGQTISYNYVVRNTGNLPVTGVTIQDSKIGTVSISNIASGGTVTVGSVYTISQADLDAGSISSTSYATGTCNDNIVQSNSVVTSMKANKPVLELEESTFPSTYDATGQIITYSYKIINTGNVQLSGPITFTDSRTDNGLPVAISQNGLAAGGQLPFTKSYAITDADINSGSVSNTAYATGTYNNRQVKSNDATSTVTAYKSALTISGTPIPENYSIEGQQIQFNYVVTNTGNVPIAGLKVIDNKSGVIAVSNAALAPQGSLSISSTRMITKADLDAGSVTTQSNAIGEYNGKDISSNTETLKIKADTEIPEFPSIILPVVAILGLLCISQYNRKTK